MLLDSLPSPVVMTEGLEDKWLFWFGSIRTRYFDEFGITLPGVWYDDRVAVI